MCSNTKEDHMTIKSIYIHNYQNYIFGVINTANKTITIVSDDETQHVTFLPLDNALLYSQYFTRQRYMGTFYWPIKHLTAN